MVDSDHTVDRRSVLKSLAAGSAVAAGVALGSGSAAARTAGPASPRGPTIADVQTHIGDVATVEQVVRDTAGPLAEALADHGYLDAATEPPVESFVGTAEFADGDADAVATAGPGRVGDTPTIDVQIRQVTADHVIEYHLLPFNDDDGYAFVTAADGDRLVSVTPDSGAVEVSSSQCDDNNTRCTTDFCDCKNGHYYYTEERELCTTNDDGECVCSWAGDGCDCQGDSVDQCPS